ncbi:MAG: hypothetical protein ACHRXM_17700 [Isosphaerales bacterium]
MNAYYDVYVKWAALILALMVSCNYLSDSHLWVDLKTGELIAAQSAPVMTDVFSYTEKGSPWVDVPWLFQWIQAELYKLVYGLVPVNPADTTANRASAENIAVGALVALAALIRLATGWLLFQIRHRGPGVWWSAICVTLALGVTFQPGYGLTMGGMARPAFAAPSTWGLFFLAFEVWLLFRAFSAGKGGALWLLIPIFLLWANIDESFLTGLVVLAAAAAGRWLDRSRTAGLPAHDGKSAKGDASSDAEIEAEPRPAGAGAAFIILACCAGVCLVNPFTYRAYLAALSPYTHWFQPAGTITTNDQLSFFVNSEIRQRLGEDWYKLPAYFLAVVALGVGSFLLNVRRFSWSRFLMFAVMSVLWGLLMHLYPAFAVVFAAVVAPNGQEWYHDRFGTEGRLGWRWSLWSTGGRLVTLTLIFLAMSLDITGWGNTQPETQFGLGFKQDDFDLEAAEFLGSHNEIQGNIFNTSPRQGDVLIWKAAPKRKTYLDSRPRLFPPELLAQWHKTRKALSDDDIAAWKPLLDKYEISVVMIETVGAPLTYRRLMKSPNWVPFYDDGRIVMFGRADAPKSDLAFFEANRLDPDLRAFRTTHPVVGAERPPNPTSWIDDIFQTKTFARLQSRTESARRWLVGPAPDAPLRRDEAQAIPEPSRCLLAIQDARTALARSPDDWVAYRLLKDAYRFLMVQEAAMLEGIPIVPDNLDRIRSVAPRLEHLMNRYQQRVTSLNYAILTTPSPKNRPARVELFGLNLELFQLYVAGNARDLARERLKLALEASEPGDIAPEMRIQLQKQLDQMTQESKQLEDKLQDVSLEQSAGPIEQAGFALSQGGIGTAITLLADAERNSISPAVVKPRLIDLYCNTGQPDKALELLAVGAIDDPNLGTEPGAGALRQGRVYFLLGNYFSASTLWQDRAIPRVRSDRSNRVLLAAGILTRGEASQSTNDFLSLPASLTQQASWEYDLAMCQLEAGTPDEAAVHFTQALTLAPDLHVRAIAEYYLKKIGKPVPPLPKRELGTAKPDASPAKGPLDPGTHLPVPTERPVLPVPSGTPSAAPSPAGARSAEPPKTPARPPSGTREPAPKKS